MVETGRKDPHAVAVTWRSYLDPEHIESQREDPVEEKIIWEFTCAQDTVPHTVLKKLMQHNGQGKRVDTAEHVPQANFSVHEWHDLTMAEYLRAHYKGAEVDFIRKRFQFFMREVNR